MTILDSALLAIAFSLSQVISTVNFVHAQTDSLMQKIYSYRLHLLFSSVRDMLQS